MMHPSEYVIRLDLRAGETYTFEQVRDIVMAMSATDCRVAVIFHASYDGKLDATGRPPRCKCQLDPEPSEPTPANGAEVIPAE